MHRKFNIKSAANRLFAIVAACAALIGMGATNIVWPNAAQAARWHQASRKRRYRRYYRHHGHWHWRRIRRAHKRRRRIVKHVRYNRRIVRVRRANPHIKKLGPNSGYVRWAVRQMYASVKNVPGNKPVDYSTATPAQMMPPLGTTHPSVYIYGNDNMQVAVKWAMTMWEPEVHFWITNNPESANVIVQLRKNYPTGAIADTETNNNGQKVISISQAAVYQEHCDMLGVHYVIAHELGHSLGLMHDSDNSSIMSVAEGLISNKYDQARYNWHPHVTSNERKMLREMYHGR